MGKAFVEISAGLSESIRHAQGKPTKVVEHDPHTSIDVKAIRDELGMNQQKFCATFGISLDTLRHWEQKRRIPRGPARVLLKVAQHNPNAIIDVMQDH